MYNTARNFGKYLSLYEFEISSVTSTNSIANAKFHVRETFNKAWSPALYPRESIYIRTWRLSFGSYPQRQNRRSETANQKRCGASKQEK